MELKRIAGILFLSFLSIFLGVQIFTFWSREREASADFLKVEEKFKKAQLDNAALQRELEYLAEPVNLEKELRARFNYKGAGEKMIIIVPPPSATSSSPPHR